MFHVVGCDDVDGAVTNGPEYESTRVGHVVTIFVYGFSGREYGPHVINAERSFEHSADRVDPKDDVTLIAHRPVSVPRIDDMVTRNADPPDHAPAAAHVAKG